MAELGDRVAALAARSRADRDARRAEIEAREVVLREQAVAMRSELRASMPMVADVVDLFRERFGDGVRVLAAAEGGRVVVNRRAMARFGLDVGRYEQASA